MIIVNELWPVCVIDILLIYVNLTKFNTEEKIFYRKNTFEKKKRIFNSIILVACNNCI